MATSRSDLIIDLVLAIGESTDSELACYVALFHPPRPDVPTVSAA